ncbi:MAG: ankyrin repeat domain-containing protein [Legionellaceae bacterium]|nr:ankyrin repeat domain-containing protein [Legionellaceae bacterium]
MYEQIREILRRIATKDRFDEDRIRQENDIKYLLDSNPLVLNKVDMYEQSLLIWASSYGNLSVVQYLILKGVNLNAATHCPGAPDHGQTALHWAYARGYYDVVHRLIEAGAIDTGINNQYRKTKSRGNQTVTAMIVLVNNHLIHQATKDGRFTIVRALISKDLNLLEQKNKEGETPLLLAARYAFGQGFEYLIEQGANVHVATHRLGHQSHGKTVLHWVYERGSLKHLKILMERGAVDTRLCGDYICDRAVRDGRLDVIQLFSELNPNFWKENKPAINRWIGLASGRMVKDSFDPGKMSWEPGWPDMVEYLARSAASHNIQLSHRSQIALVAPKKWSSTMGKAPSVFKFVERGVGLDDPIHNPGHPSHGKTAVEWAFESKHYFEMGFLLDAGARVDYFLGQRLIFLATKCATVTAIERLLDDHPRLKEHRDGWYEHTAIDMILETGEFASARYPLILAARRGYKNIVLDLIKKGQDVNTVVDWPEYLDVHGKAALRLAYEAQQYKMVELLLDAGAQDRVYTGSYLIHQAALDGRCHIVNSLLKNMPELLNQEDACAHTPLDWAIKGEHAAVCDVLVQAGAFANIQTEQAEAYLAGGNLRSFSIFESQASQDEDLSVPGELDKKRKRSETLEL